MQTIKSGAPEESSATPSTRSRNVSSPHWTSSNRTTSGASSSSSLRNAQAISSADVPRSDSPSNDRIEEAAAGSEGKHVHLLHHLHHRPVGDPVSIGQAAAANDPCASIDSQYASASSRDFRHRPSPTTVNSSHRCSVLARPHASTINPELPLPADEARPDASRSKRRQHRHEAVGRHRLRLALQPRAAPPAPPRPTPATSP